ncbi:hypothetical protein ACFLRU_05705 [Bacteroidota bacterium]
MKRLIPIFIIAIFLIPMSNISAQSKNQLRSPKAKNYKAWQDKNKSSLVLVTQNKKTLKSPEAKNYKPWKVKSTQESEKYVVSINKRKRKLRSPEVKNYKPWIK